MRSRSTLTVADARVILDSARGEAERIGSACSITVVDDAGVPILLERLDDARLHTPEASILKARTAAVTRSDTADLQHAVQETVALLSFPGRMPLAGGMPIHDGDQVVGGIGCSGGTPEQDVAVCRAGLAALLSR